MSKQIIIIDSPEALAKKIEGALGLEDKSYAVPAILACLHPIEVPSDAERLAKAVEAAIKPSYIESPNGRGGVMIISKDYSDAAALITTHSRTVPRAMLEEYAKAYFTSYELRIDQDNLKERTANFFAAKYGYRAE